MLQNMFWFDRALRSAVGTIMLLMAFFYGEMLLYAMGGLLAATGVTGFCPLHKVIGVNEAAGARS